MSNNSLFFLDDGDGLQDTNTSFTINEKYAEKYEAKKKHEELSALKEKYGDVEGLDEEKLERIAERRRKYGIADVDQSAVFDNDEDEDDFEDSEDEEEDELAEMVTPEIDVQIMQTLARIKGKHPEIYNESQNFFGDDQLEKARDAWKLKQEELKNSKPVTLKDFHRQTLLESGGMVETTSAEHENTDLTFHEEQAKLKNELKSAIAQEAEEDEGGDEFFTKRSKSSQEIEKEEDEYRNFLIESMNQSDDRSQAALREWQNFKNNPDMDKDESFLMDYILNRGWIDKSAQKTPSYKEIVDDSEDEEAVERADRFESLFNHRFEEEGGAKIVTHAREIEGTIRRKDNKRTLARQSVAERKAEEKIRQQEELKRLKNLKKEEIRQKLLKIQEVAGVNSSTGLGLEEVDLEEDFDPEKHDMVMSKNFSDNYYNDQGANVKPVFDDDIDISDIVNAEELKFNPAESKSKKNKKKKKKEEPKWKEEEFNMDADYVPDAELCEDGYYDDQGYQGEEAYGEEAAEDMPQAAIKKKRTLDDFLGEYYQLDYEDMIGDLPTRFKYGQTSKTDYGLTPAEILMADDTDLNEYYSLKKLAPFRAAHKQSADRSKFKSHKHKRLREFRQKLLANIQEDPELSAVINKSQSAWAIGAKPKLESQQEKKEAESTDPKKQKRNEKRRERAKKAKHALDGGAVKQPEAEGEDIETEDVERKKKRRKKSAKRTTD